MSSPRSRKPRASAPRPAASTPASPAREAAPPLDGDLASLIERLAAAVDRYHLTEIEVTGDSVRVRRDPPVAHAPAAHPHVAAHHVTAAPGLDHPPAVAAPAPAAALVAPPALSSVPAAAPAEPSSASPAVYITSPFVGTFYRAPSPDAPPFVEVGQRVKKGQVLCIIEAMKLMNEIESDVAGTIVEVLPENGRAVEYGQALFQIRP